MNFVGYTHNFNTYRFYDPLKNKIIISCNARFLDTIGPVLHVASGSNSPPDSISMPIVYIEPMQTPTDATNHSPTPINESFYGNLSNVQSNSVNNDELSESTSFVNEQDAFVSFTSASSKDEIAIISPESSIIQRSPNASTNSQASSYSQDEITIVQSEQSQENQSPIQNNSPPTIEAEPIYANTGPNLRPKSSVSYKNFFSNRTKHSANLCIEEMEDPKTFNEAMSRSDSDKWLAACEEEIAALDRCEVTELVDRPNSNIVSCRWVFKLKKSPTNEILRYRARLVARGFTQEKGIDFFETYAPVCEIPFIRLIFAYAAHRRLIIQQFDVQTAFLYGDLDECVFMDQPPGFNIDKSKVFRLKKALYGLKQASRQWNVKFTSFLTKLGLKQNHTDNCIFMQESPLLILAIYVDDAIVVAQEQQVIDSLIKELQSVFPIHNVQSNIFLGFQYERTNDGSIILHQQAYINRMLQQYNMQDSNTVPTPELIAGKPDLTKSQELDDVTPYRQAVGSLIYAATTTRIDIAHATAKVAQISKPTERNWLAIKRIFRYLKGTSTYGIQYNPSALGKLTCYCDANFAGDQQDFKSTTGYLFTFAGGPIAWRSKKQHITTTSSTEAEFVSLCAAVKDATVYRNLSIELSICREEPVVVNCDNQSTIKIAQNEKAAKRTRHLGTQIQYPKEQINKNIVQIKHVSSNEQLADMLTKSLGPQKFIPNRDSLMTCLTLLTLICISHSEAYKFNTVDPIVYASTNYHVEKSLTEYEIDFTYISPCKPLYNPRDTFWGILNGEYHEWTRLKSNCQEFYNSTWMSKINELSRLHAKPHFEFEKQTNQNIINHRTRRGIVSDLMIGGGGFIIGACASNILKSTLSTFGYKNPQDERIQEIEQQLDEERRRINTFDKNFNITRHINLELIKTTKQLAQAVENNHREIQQIANRELSVAWTISYLQSRITEGSHKLDSIISKYPSGTLDTRALGELIGMPELMSIDERNSIMKSIVLKGESTITFKFAIRKPSTDTDVVRIIGFKHWINLTIRPKLIEYDGWKFAIFNRTCNCISAIEEPIDRFVLDDCSMDDFVDPRLTIWKDVPVSLNTESPFPVTTAHSSADFTYIYCYPNNVTINGIVYACPAEPFVVNNNMNFTTSGIRRNYNKKKPSINQLAPNLSHMIQTSHYTTEIFNYTKTIDAYNELKSAAQGYRIYDDNLKPLPIYRQPIIQASIGSLLLVILFCGITIHYIRSRRAPVYEEIEFNRNCSPSVPKYAPPLPPKNSA